MFNPWTATFEEVQEATKQFEGSNLENPLDQWVAVQRINSKRDVITAGNGFAVLACLRLIVTHGLVAPEWLTYAFNGRYDAVLNCRAKSWDSPLSFGKPYKLGTNINALRKRRLLRFAVLNEVKKILASEPNQPIDESLFERVAEKFYIGKTQVSEYYYEAKKMNI